MKDILSRICKICGDEFTPEKHKMSQLKCYKCKYVRSDGVVPGRTNRKGKYY